jgi:hypothetical protein
LAAAAFIAKPSRFLIITDKFHSQIQQAGSTGRFWRQVLEAGSGGGFWRRVLEAGSGGGFWRRVLEEELHGRAFYLSG